MKTKLTRRQRTLRLEPLEQRLAMAVFGTPWPEPRSLSVSFPSDAAAIGPYNNSVRQVFDQVTDRLQWQEAALRAFQTWSVQANINVGLVPDRGDALGAIGLGSNDPRFGEFRIGAFPQTGVLANALPYQQPAGSWSGDVFLNTQTHYFLADWQSTSPIQVPEPNAKGPAVELFSVLLHEAGNALGLADNAVAGAVMNGTYTRPNGTLKASDVRDIRALYGARRDIYEPVSNNTRDRATRISDPTGFNGSQPLSVNGSLNTMSDIDYYRFTPLAGKEQVTVRLWASGISLLKGQLEVLDRFGNKIADAKADSLFANNLQLEIGSLADHPTLYLRVARNSSDVFGIGDYRIDLDYRLPELQPSIVPPRHDADAEDDDDETVDFVSVDALFAQVGLVDTEVGRNDTLATASPLETTTGYLDRTRYELQSAISSAEDRDLWKFVAPAEASPTLHIHLDPVGVDNPNLEVILLNAAGDRIRARGTHKADGGVSLAVANPVAGETYVLFVRTAAGSAVTQGNYVATLNFATDPASLRTVYSGSVTSSTEDISRLDIAKTKLFRFDLLASGAANDGVQLTLYDARTGDIVASFASASSVTRTEYVWLNAGSYYLRASSRSRTGAPSGRVAFTLRGSALSDDQGPLPIDPTQAPDPTVYPDWEWTDANSSTPPVIIDYVDPPRENPWTSDFIFGSSRRYYQQVLV